MSVYNLYSVDDAELLRQLSEGSRRAFDNLYYKYWKHVYNAAYKRLNNADQAQDVAQDVFVQLWTRASTAPIDNLPAYLLVAARNGVFKHLEKESRYAALPDTADQLKSAHGEADSGMLHEEFVQAFNDLVNALPEQQRIIFKMRYEEDLSSQQIAEILNLSPKTVRNQIGKSLATIKSSLLLLNILFFFCIDK
ncbi:RNA polymerase sigma-70 factor [Mucilaginibacter gynuensis]|uniref:RNA polymerase sigma-70 factor n=1 Tax=Mucilaginibacter gynuensis TaxID=1302236 RepID=A0ABP8FVK2_9SPHI